MALGHWGISAVFTSFVWRKYSEKHISMNINYVGLHVFYIVNTFMKKCPFFFSLDVDSGSDRQYRSKP